jgi:hypothetical protein
VINAEKASQNKISAAEMMNTLFDAASTMVG